MVGRWCALGVAAAVAVGAAACSSGGGEAAPPPPEAPSITTSTPPPPTVVSDEQAVLTAYQGYWSTILDLSGLEPVDVALDQYATGPALSRSTDAIANQRAVGQYVALPPSAKYRHQPTLESRDGEVAFVRDCAVDDGLLLAYGSNSVIDDSVTTRLLLGRVVRVGGTWLVDDVTTMRQWDGVTQCAG